MKQHRKLGEKNKTGAIGEAIAENYLKKIGLKILGTNYLKKWGEIDIVAHETTRDMKIIHFVEVKTVSYETKEALEHAVSCGFWRPEENVTRGKISKMNRAIESWLEEHEKISYDWQIDVVAVRIVKDSRIATIKYLENVIY